MSTAEALNVAIVLLDEYLTEYSQRADDFEILIKAKSALSDIEKCEPVAYIHKHYLNEDKDALDWHKREHPQFKMIPLYTSPISKEWVGLSDEEIFKLCPYIDHDLLEEAFYKGARAIEAKLKELNQ